SAVAPAARVDGRLDVRTRLLHHARGAAPAGRDRGRVDVAPAAKAAQRPRYRHHPTRHTRPPPLGRATQSLELVDGRAVRRRLVLVPARVGPPPLSARTYQ